MEEIKNVAEKAGNLSTKSYDIIKDAVNQQKSIRYIYDAYIINLLNCKWNALNFMK